MGTMVVGGNGKGIVVAISEFTEFGNVFLLVKVRHSVVLGN